MSPNDVSRAGVLIYQRTGDGAAGIDLWTVALDGREPDTPLLATPAGESDARFSPDGRRVAYVSGSQGLRGQSTGSVSVFVRPYPKADETQ